ncbi:MAG TPA: hypothetical protein VK846_15675, partial [Candidatus Limnocylindria bacterium]|nr:hypothetical protein [Candidatus Limnocylindria bacterium]
YENGFAIGEALLIYDPGTQTQPGTAPMTQTSGGSGTIKFGSILEFDDLRIGVTDFAVTFGAAVDFDGTIFVASGGAKFMPGKPISATITDRLTTEPNIAPGIPDTEAIRLGLQFENGQVKGFIFKADTLRITIGSVLTLTARDLEINTAAADNQEMLSVGAVGAEVKIGSLVLGGEGRNFAFLGDGTFVTKPGFGVFLSIGSASGDSFMWPSWLPIKISEVGISWPNIQENPADFVLTLSASVTGLQGMAGLEFAGTIEGVKIDVGRLLEGKFPITDIASIGVSLKGDLFGGQIEAALIGGILKLDANGGIIDTFDIMTPVEERVFFIGVEGGFSFSGVGGFTIRFAVSELGPLGVFITGSIPGGILLEPNTGLSINDFSAGVEFFKTLPSIDRPEQLRGPEFGLPTAQSPEQWLAGVKLQVTKQYLAIKANPGMNGFAAAFTAPMLITGGAKLFSIYTSKEVFNGEVIIRFSTDGKFLVIGKLNFAADNLSISGKLYADLSKIAAGEATVLFLADIPDQVQLLTIDGRLKMGFRNPSGEEVVFQVVDPQTGQPYARLAGPNDGGVIGAGTLNGRGYIDVLLPDSSGQLIKDGQTIQVTGALSSASVLDLAPELQLSFTVSDPANTLVLDNNQPPVHLQGNVFRFWTQGTVANGEVKVIFLKETWSYQASNGDELFNQIGAYQDQDDAWQGLTPDTQSISPVIARYIDIKFVAAAGAEITAAQLQSIAELGAAAVFSLEYRTAEGVLGTAPSPGTAVALGNGTVRYFFTGEFAPGIYTVLFVGNGAVNTLLGEELQQRTDSFSVVTPTVNVAAPFAANKPNGTTEIVAIDVNVLNAQQHSGQYYIDIIFKPSPGIGLDYDSILDSSDSEFTLQIDSVAFTVSATPLPIEMAFNDDFILMATVLTGAEATPEKLEEAGVTRFRYLITGLSNFTPGQVVLTFDANTWTDKAGNGGPAGTWTFGVDGPTAVVVSPADGGNIDIGELNNRNYIDVTFPAAPAGYGIDFSSITDLAPEFTLNGAGVGSIQLDAGQVPIVLGAGQVRYWVSGRFATGDVTVAFASGSWSFTSVAARNPTVTTITLDDPSFITVNFDDLEAGFQNDPSSILDLAAEFGLSYSGTGAITLVGNEAPLRLGDTNSYRFRVSGDFVSDGTETVTLLFNIGDTWSFTQEDYAPGTAMLTNPSATNDRTYIDVAIATSVDITPLTSPLTITDALDGPEIQITGAGGNGVTVSGAPHAIGAGVFRYYLDGQFAKGVVNVAFDAAAIVDSAGNESRVMASSFTVQGATGSIQGPQDGGSIGILTQNNRGFIDVTFGFLDLDLESIFDLDADENGLPTHLPEFTLSDPAIQLDGRQLPALISQTASTYTFRYWVSGSYTSGPLTATLIPGRFTMNGNLSTSTDTLNIANPNTVNLTYIDVRYRATDGYVLDVDSITDAPAEFELFQDEAGAEAITAVTPSTNFHPVRLTNSDTFRYFFDGSFEAGVVWVRFAQDSFQSVEADGAGIESSGGIGNLAKVESFTVAELTANLINPVADNTVDSNLINQRGYIDVSFPAPPGAAQIDLATVFDFAPEFTVTVNSPAGATLVIDGGQRPVLINAATNTFRYWYTGTFISGEVGITFTTDTDGLDNDTDGQVDELDENSVSFLKVDGETVALAAGSTTLTVAADANLSYIDVRFQTAGGVPLDETTILDAGHEFGLSGAGLGTASLSNQAPTQLGSSTDGLDNDNDGQVDEVDENVYRFYITRGFAVGSVSITYIAGSWNDGSGNLGTAGTQSFQVIEAIQDSGSGSGGEAVGRVFYIEISGGIKLQGLGFTDEPIIDIRGRVVLEIGDFQIADGNGDGIADDPTIVKHFTLEASGTIKIIKLGNIGSAAARFVLLTGDTVSGNPEFWGVAKIQANFDFLKNYGIFADGSAMLQINTTPTIKTEQISLEGIPGDIIAPNLTLSLSTLSNSPLASVPIPDAWVPVLKPLVFPAFDGLDSDKTVDGVQPFTLETILEGATVQTIITGQKWKIITKGGPVFFVETAGNGKVDLRAEVQTFDLPARSFSIQIVGSLKIKANGSSDPQADDWVVFTGGFFL